RSFAFLTGIITIIILLNFDKQILIYLTNPYRDPLSFMLLLFSMLLFLRYLELPFKRIYLLAFSGLMLGFAYCVRETSILVAGPAFLCGWVYWCKNRNIKFWKSILVFGVFLMIGGLPVLCQSYLKTGITILPPQSVDRGIVLPGLTVSAYSSTFKHTIEYFEEEIGAVGFLMFLIGMISCLKARNKIVLAFLLPAVIVYFMFYSFYEYFVRRYFYIVMLFAAPIMALGFLKLLDLVLRVLRRECWRRAVFVSSVVILSGITSWLLLTFDGPSRFRVANAKLLSGDLKSLIPQKSLVLCDRNLCEVLRYFHDIDSYPCYEFCEGNLLSPEEVSKGIASFTASEKKVYLMSSHGIGMSDANVANILAFRNLELQGELKPTRYNLMEVCDEESLFLYEVKPWHETTTSNSLKGPLERKSILCVDVRNLWNNGIIRKYARLYLDGNLIDDHLENGVNYYEINVDPAINQHTIELKSDAIVPEDISPTIIPYDAPLKMDLGIEAVPFDKKWLSAQFFEYNLDRCRYARALVKRGTITLPCPWKSKGRGFAEFYVASAFDGTADYLQIDFLDHKGRILKSCKLSPDSRGSAIMVPLGFLDGVGSQDVTIDVTPVRNENKPSPVAAVLDAVEIDNVIIHHFQKKRFLSVDVGGEQDSPFISSGFYNREITTGHTSVRWTSDRAAMNVYMVKPETDFKVVLWYFDRHRHPKIREPELKLFFNAQGFDGAVVVENDLGLKRMESIIPKECFSDANNVLELVCVPWVPGEYCKTPDSRKLGIMLDRIDVRPIEVVEDN
ncbi:hypothetical protein ACFLS1_09460, partial [Verrucomicrobiota bacterium]